MWILSDLHTINILSISFKANLFHNPGKEAKGGLNGLGTGPMRFLETGLTRALKQGTCPTGELRRKERVPRES